MRPRTSLALLFGLLALPLLAQSVAFENERVRVLTPRIAPGEGRPLHEHPARVIVALVALHLGQALADGSTSEVRLEPGVVRFSAPVRHAVRNLGDAVAELVEVELLPAAGESQAAPVSDVAQDPAHLALEVDNEQVRVLRLRLAPHASSALLRQGDRVTIALGAAQLRLSTPDGRDVECRLERGSAQMQTAASHVVQNLGGQPVELISIELKRKPAAR